MRRNAHEAANNIPYPNGYHDIRRYVPGNVSAGVQIIAHMYDLNSVTGAPNGPRDCCIQLPTDPVPINSSCTPDPGCGPRQGFLFRRSPENPKCPALLPLSQRMIPRWPPLIAPAKVAPRCLAQHHGSRYVPDLVPLPPLQHARFAAVQGACKSLWDFEC